MHIYIYIYTIPYTSTRTLLHMYSHISVLKRKKREKEIVGWNIKHLLSKISWMMLTCMPTSMEIVLDDATSRPSILESMYPKKKPDAWRREAASTTCIPDWRIAEELWAMAFPHRIATVATAMGGIKGEKSLTTPWKYWFRNAPPKTGRSTTWFIVQNSQHELQMKKMVIVAII